MVQGQMECTGNKSVINKNIVMRGSDAIKWSFHLVDAGARLTIMSVGNEKSSEIDEIDASVSAQRGTVPQLSGRRLKHVDGLCGKWGTAGTKRRG